MVRVARLDFSYGWLDENRERKSADIFGGANACFAASNLDISREPQTDHGQADLKVSADGFGRIKVSRGHEVHPPVSKTKDSATESNDVMRCRKRQFRLRRK